jgi:hypothetical protein
VGGARCWRNFREPLKMRSETLPGIGCKKAISLPATAAVRPVSLTIDFPIPLFNMMEGVW